MSNKEVELLAKVVIIDDKAYYKNDDGTLELLGKPEKETINSELQWKINEHGKMCDFIKNLYKTKNADYGDSMHPLYEEYGLTSFLVLFGIKIQRIKTLMQKTDANYESLEDSLMDLANYALIALTEIKAEKNKRVDVVRGDTIDDIREQIMNMDKGNTTLFKAENE